MLAQQNANMAELERRRAAERAGQGGGPRVPPPGARAPLPRMEDDDSGDELENISTRTLAKTRYMRNHEYMNQVFAFAAFGDKSVSTKRVSGPYSEWKKEEMEEKITKLKEEVAALERAAEERRREGEMGDVRMGEGVAA